MSTPTPTPLCAAAGSGTTQSRSASKAFVQAASGFHVFRIEGYSLLTKTIPGGEKISSQQFIIGGRRWRVDLYPNGADGSKVESDSIALYLVYDGELACYRHADQPLNRVVAQYKFCLLDHAGSAAYEIPAEKGVFTDSDGEDDRCRCGHDTFISRDELEARRARLLLKDDCLAIRCDVGVIDQLMVQSIAVGRSARDDTDTDDSSSSSSSDDSCFETDSEKSRRRNKRRRLRQAAWLDDTEYVLRSLKY